MKTRAVLIALALALGGCGDKKEVTSKDKKPAEPVASSKPATPSPASAPSKTAPGPAAPAAPPVLKEEVIKYTKTDLGRVSADPQPEPEKLPLLALTPTGDPVVGYEHGGKLYVSRREGDAWKAVGDAVACARPIHQRDLAVDPNGTVLVAGLINDSQGAHDALVCVLQNNAKDTKGAWAPLGDPIGDENAAAGAISLIVTKDGPMVFMTQTRGDEESIGVWRLEGKSWQELERLRMDKGMRVSRVAAAATDTGAVVAWIARNSPEPPVLETRRWGAARKWELISRIDDVDGDSTFELTSAPDGTVFLARTSSPGFKEVLMLRPADVRWTSIKTPGDNRVSTNHGAPVVASGRKDEVILAWAGDLIAVAAHDGKQWSDVVRNLGRKASVQMNPRVAAAADGSFVLVWRDSDSTVSEPARILAAQFKPAP